MPTPASFPSLAVDVHGNPVLAWTERSQAATIPPFLADIFVKRWTGTYWESLGGAVPGLPEGSLAGSSSLEMDGSGRPVVAWYNVSGIHVFINRWEGQWLQIGRLGDDFINAPVVSRPSLQFDGAGNAMLAWSQADGLAGGYPPPTSNAYVGQWDSGHWKRTGPLSAIPESQTSAVGAVLKTRKQGEPILAWDEFDGVTTSIFVRQLSAEGWIPLGSALSARAGVTPAQKPSVEWDATGNPVVAWKEPDEEGASSNLYVQRWSGDAWEPIGNGVNSDPTIARVDDPVLGVDAAGNLIVAWAGNDVNTTNIYVSRWNQGHWELLAPPLSANPGVTDAAHPSLRVGPDGAIFVAWDEAVQVSGVQTRHVYVYQFNG